MKWFEDKDKDLSPNYLILCISMHDNCLLKLDDEEKG